VIAAVPGAGGALGVFDALAGCPAGGPPAVRASGEACSTALVVPGPPALAALLDCFSLPCDISWYQRT
jgi:hypothetical protein